MTLQTWLAGELRDAGLVVHETNGWTTRQTRNGFDPVGIVNHDTVTPPGISLAAEQAILIKGRPDLAGPLAQTGGHRDGSVSVIAAGRCNHNGYGLWGNDAFGHEVFCYGGLPGHIEPWNAAQRRTSEILNAVICRHFGWNESRVKGHKETDPTRKIDPFGTDMGVIRGDVAFLLRNQPYPPVPPPPTRTHDMITIFVTTNGRYYLLIPQAVWAEIDPATGLATSEQPNAAVVVFKNDEAQQRTLSRLNKEYGDPSPLDPPPLNP